MACRGCLECLLKLLNFILTVVGLAMVGYGIYLLVEWKRISDGSAVIPGGEDGEFLKLGRPMLLAISLPSDILDKLPRACGAAIRNGCCLTCYSVLVSLLILAELGCAAFIFFDHSWKDAIPVDKTGDFDMIYGFLKKNWKIAKWVAVGAVVLEALVFLLALVVRAANRSAEYDSDDEYIGPRPNMRQPLINRQSAPVTGVPVTGFLDHRPSRKVSWSTRTREKYGLDESEFPYNPTEANRFQQAAAAPAEEKGWCSIM